MAEPWTPGPWHQQRVLPHLVSGPDEAPYITHVNVHRVATWEADARLIAAAPEMAALLAQLATMPAVVVGLLPEVQSLLARIQGEAPKEEA